MIFHYLEKQVLSIGCEYKSPKGGIAQILYNYANFVYSTFKFIPISGKGNKFIKLLKMIRGMFCFIVKISTNPSIKIIHIHTASNNSFRRSAMYVKLARVFNKKVIIHVHGGEFEKFYEKNKELVTNTLDSCNCIICLSKKWSVFFKQIAKCKRIEVVNNVIPYPEKRIIEKDGKLHILFLGLLCKQKGIYDLLNVLVNHREVFGNKIVLHIGGNGETKQVKSYIHEHQIEEFVKIEGWVDGDRKKELLSLCSVYVLPSYAEGLPMSILEAMAYRMVIISTRVGGIPEIVEDGLNGFLYTPGDQGGLYKGLMFFLDNPSLVQEFGNCSYNIVQAFFPNVVGKQLEKIYLDILNEEELH